MFTLTCDLPWSLRVFRQCTYPVIYQSVVYFLGSLGQLFSYLFSWGGTGLVPHQRGIGLH